METIRNYLETMFSSLPNTPEVLRAKNELLQMMEDKYNHLKNEGKSENEAVGIVIAEFGNLDEIAEDLGINRFVKETEYIATRKVTLEQVKQFLHDQAGHGFKISLGVFLCIISPVGAIFTSETTHYGVLGILFLLLSIAAAVFLFVYSSITVQKWDFLKKESCSIDFATTNYVHEQKERYRSTYALLLTLGVVLCVVCFVPAAVIDELNLRSFWIFRYNIDAILLLLLVAAGVFMIILTNYINGSYRQILQLNNKATVGGNYVSSQKENVRYINPLAETIMSVYWTTVTCIYLCWSFLTFDWHYTWIIWPIASVIHALLNSTLRRDDYE